MDSRSSTSGSRIGRNAGPPRLGGNHRRHLGSLRRWIAKQGYPAEEVYREFSIVAEPNLRELWPTELQQPVRRR